MRNCILRVVAACLVAACAACEKPQQERAIERAAEVGVTVRSENCVNVAGGEHGDDLSICTDGRKLIICSEDDDCLTVNLDPELPESR